MRVLMLAQFYAPIIGGEERMAETMATALAERGHELAVATLRQPGQDSYEEIAGVPVHRLGGLAQRVPGLFSEPGRRHAPPLGDPETVAGLRRLLRDLRPDIVHTHNWLDHAYLPLAPRSDAAFVISLHDYSLICANKRLIRVDDPCSGPAPAKCRACAANQYGRLSGPVIATLVRRSERRRRALADRMLPISRYVAERCGLPGGSTPWEVMPNFLTGDGRAATGGSGLDLPDGAFIQFAGDLTTDKGVHVLLHAYGELDAAPPLVMIGRPIDVDPETVPDGVTVCGPVPHADVLAAWERCTVAVVPSLQPEAFGVVALEAMRAGKPVIAARSGGLPEVVEHERSGLLVEPGDAGSLRDALERVLGDDALRRTLSEGARLRAAQFTGEQVVPRLEQAYETAIEHRRAR
ncbi:MAG: glycosyltransferase family 4 protein [Baekduia sp.]